MNAYQAIHIDATTKNFPQERKTGQHYEEMNHKNQLEAITCIEVQCN